MRPVSTLPLLGLLLGLSLRAGAADPTGEDLEWPSYDITPCCQLCPAAADPAAYTGGYLRSFRQLIQGRDGWLFRSEDDFKSEFALSPKSYHDLGRFRDALAARGVTLVMLPLPPRGLIEWRQLEPEDQERFALERTRNSYAAFLESLRSTGIAVPPLEELLEAPMNEAFYFSRDHHWRPAGARRTAELVARALQALPAFAEIESRQFQTRADGVIRKGGTLTGAVRRLCGFGYTEEVATRFVTSTEGSGDELLSDSAAPQIVLAGTSNSDTAYNFSGFLSEYAGVDVLNVSVAGGDVEGALLEYFSSAAFQEQAPSILIWEMPGYSNIDDDRVYRQVIPMIANGCRTGEPELQATAPLGVHPEEALFNGNGVVRPLTGGDHLLDVTVSNDAIRELKFTVWYTNGKKDSFTISHPEHADTRGRFVVELRNDPDFRDATFLSLDLASQKPQPEGTQADVLLCRRQEAT